MGIIAPVDSRRRKRSAALPRPAATGEARCVEAIGFAEIAAIRNVIGNGAGEACASSRRARTTARRWNPGSSRHVPI